MKMLHRKLKFKKRKENTLHIYYAIRSNVYNILEELGENRFILLKQISFIFKAEINTFFLFKILFIV